MATNDLFADAFEVVVPTDGATYTYVGDANTNNSTFGMESGEPQPTSYISGRSGWWKYTPASSGTITVDTEPSNGDALDTELGIYTGSAVNALTKVASDSDSGSGNKSLIAGLAVTAGTTYYIQVTTWDNRTTCYYGINLTGPASLVAGASGSLSATLPPLAASLAGGIEFAGTITATLPALGANLSGSSVPAGIAGTLSATLPPLGGSLAGAYSDTATLSAILPPLSGSLAGTVLPPPVTGALAATLPGLTANLAGSAFEPGTSGFVAAVLPALSASLSGVVLGRTGLGLCLDSSAVLTVDPALEPEPTVPPGTPATVLHITAPTVPVPTLVAGRPQ